MANYQFSFPVTDEGGRVSNVSGYLVAADQSAADARMTILMQTVDALVGGVIGTTYNLIEERTVAPVGIKTSADVGADRRKKGKFTFNDSAGHPKLISLPSFDDVVFGLPDGTINLANGTVTAFVSEITGQAYATNRYEDLVTLAKAVESFGG